VIINTNLPPMLHRFRYIAFDRSKIAIFGYPSRLTTPPPPRRRGSAGSISVKFYISGLHQSTKWRRNIAEDFNRLSKAQLGTLQTDRRQTDGRQASRLADIADASSVCNS